MNDDEKLVHEVLGTDPEKPNKTIIQAWAKAKRRGDVDQIQKLGKELDEFQRLCPHPSDKHRITIIKKDSANRKYLKDGKLSWCLRCNMVLGYTPP